MSGDSHSDDSPKTEWLEWTNQNAEAAMVSSIPFIISDKPGGPYILCANWRQFTADEMLTYVERHASRGDPLCRKALAYIMQEKLRKGTTL